MIELNVTAVIPAQIDRVWAVIRDFNAMPVWHPLIRESRIETGAPSDQVGCVRNFSLTNDARIREQLISLSDLDHSFAYSILEADVQLLNYTAGVKLKQITSDNTSFGQWWAKFDTPPGKEEEMSNMVKNDVFQAGFDALVERFS
tara:strand:- start:456 stop:890 length:435 start_codon:yes stop_codon:yes gene_type:complete